MVTKTRFRWAAMLALVLLIAASFTVLLVKPASSQTATQTPLSTTATEAVTATSAVGATTTAAATGTSEATTTRTPAATSTVIANTRTPTPASLPPIATTSPSVPVTALQVTQRSITVSGRGTVEGQPDMAVISLGVRTEDDNAASALIQNNTQMQALIDSLTDGGVAQSDIRTLTIQLFPRYQPPPANDPGGSPVVNGFIATNIVEVTVRDLDNLGDLLDAAVQAGGNQVEGIRFEIDEQQALLDQAREAAMLDARRKAEQLASLAGARLGVVITIVESSQSPIPFLREVAQADSSVPISPGTQSIQVDITVTWELQ